MSSFKQVLKTCLLFVLVVAVLSFGIAEAFFYGENYYYQDIREREEVSGTIDYIICGSSHAMRALEPSVIDEELGVNSYNLSIANVTMQGRYEMLQLELERNPVDTVVLCVSYNTLTKTREKKGFEGDFYVLAKLNLWQRIPYFFESIEPSEYISIYYEFLMKGFNCMNWAVHGMWTDKNTKVDRGYMAYDYLHSEEDEEEKLTTDYASIYNTKSFTEEIYEPNVTYLRKILELCEEKGVQVILASIPLSETYLCTYDNYDVFRSWYEQIAEAYGLDYYDFNLYKENTEMFSDMEDFHDVQHLNNPGADRFSHIYTEVMNKAEDGENVDDLFYDSYEELKEVYRSRFEQE